MSEKTIQKKPNHFKTAYDAVTSCVRIAAIVSGVKTFIVCTLVTAVVTIILQHYKVI